jgi:hypothetical protein
MTYTAKDKAQEARREVGYRKYVYTRKVNDGTMKMNDAEQRIAIMQSIAEDYAKLAEAEDKAGRLL